MFILECLLFRIFWIPRFQTRRAQVPPQTNSQMPTYSLYQCDQGSNTSQKDLAVMWLTHIVHKSGSDRVVPLYMSFSHLLEQFRVHLASVAAALECMWMKLNFGQCFTNATGDLLPERKGTKQEYYFCDHLVGVVSKTAPIQRLRDPNCVKWLSRVAPVVSRPSLMLVWEQICDYMNF